MPGDREPIGGLEGSASAALDPHAVRRASADGEHIVDRDRGILVVEQVRAEQAARRWERRRAVMEPWFTERDEVARADEVDDRGVGDPFAAPVSAREPAVAGRAHDRVATRT